MEIPITPMRTPSLLFALCLVCFSIEADVVDHELALLQTSDGEEPEPIEDYNKHIIHGFTVYLSSRSMDENPEQTESALWLIRSQIAHFNNIVPLSARDELRSVRFILNDEGTDLPEGAVCPFACYHSTNEGMYAKSISIRNLKMYVGSAWGQPGLLIHELAHAYHDQCLPGGFNNGDIHEAYDKAKDSGDYDSVAHIWGDWIIGRGENPRHNTKAYAMTNDREFFAELSEAIWSRNDYWPFVYYDLFTEDRASFDVVYDQWWYFHQSDQDHNWSWSDDVDIATPTNE